MDEHVYHILRIGVHFTYEINNLGSVWMNKCITQCKRFLNVTERERTLKV